MRIVRAAVAGLGLALVRDIYAAEEVAAGRLAVALDRPWPTVFAYYVVTLPDARRLPQISARILLVGPVVRTTPLGQRCTGCHPDLTKFTKLTPGLDNIRFRGGMTQMKNTGEGPPAPRGRPVPVGKGRAYRVAREHLRDVVKVVEHDAGVEVLVLVKSGARGGHRGIQKALESELLKPVAPEVVPIEARRGPRKPAHKRINVEAFEPGAKARALLRGIEIAEKDLRAAGGTYELAEVEQLLNISRQAIAKKVDEGALLAVPGPGNRRRYPAVQFTQGGTLPGLREVLAALPGRNAWYQLNWLVNPDPRIENRTPAQLLEAGDVATAVAAARAQGEQGG